MPHLKSYPDNLIATALERERNGGKNEFAGKTGIDLPHALDERQYDLPLGHFQDKYPKN